MNTRKITWLPIKTITRLWQTAKEIPNKFNISAETFNKVSGGVNSVASTLAILAAGIWAITRYSVLLEAQMAEAQLKKLDAEAEIARRTADSKEIVNIDLSVQVLKSNAPSHDRWANISVTLKNTGTKDYIISLDDDVRFYVAKVVETKENGEITYENISRLAFDYADKRLTWFNLRPGADLDSYRTIKKIDAPGLYIARFSARAPKIADKPSHEYSAQTFFVVD